MTVIRDINFELEEGGTLALGRLKWRRKDDFIDVCCWSRHS